MYLNGEFSLISLQFLHRVLIFAILFEVLVHGEQNEMSRLKSALIREYEDDPDYNIDIHNPRNTSPVAFHFRGEKMAKVSRKGLQYHILIGVALLICSYHVTRGMTCSKVMVVHFLKCTLE